MCYLKDRLEAADGSDGTARYLLDCLSAKQTAAIAQAILNDSVLSKKIEIKLPRNFVKGCSLPENVLTDERTTFFRNADCEKDALLLATTGDDEQQSLKDMTPIGSSQLLGHPSLWVDYANAEIGCDEQQKGWWALALRGLLEVRTYQLEAFAGYVIETRRQILEEGEPLLEALGLALPALRIPRDKTFFNVLNDKNAGHISRWKQLYAKAIRQRACYLFKYTPSQGLLTQDQLKTTFDKVKDNILQQYHSCIKEFISADKRKESQKQLRDTVRRIREALFDEPACMDRNLWLSRLSNLVMTGVYVPSDRMAQLAKWRDALREGNCEIFVRGYSHVFISGPSDSPECSDFSVVAELDDAYQEVFSRAKVRSLIFATKQVVPSRLISAQTISPTAPPCSPRMPRPRP